MDYTLTRIDPDGENDRYPLQKQEIVTDPWSSTFIVVCIWANSRMPYTTW
ncbi:NADH dehydrogenase I subunit B [Atlantibacter hermannii]|nr:NADH dehydrogenase I subunit B [Atlantibacter hermannii]